MQVPLTPDQEAELSRLASRTGKNAEALAQEAIAQLLRHEAHYVDAVEKGFDSLDRGEHVEHDEVNARIERLFQS